MDEREAFCAELGPHLTEALETLGFEDPDWQDGHTLADVVYCRGYRLPATPPGATT